jgi:hypothetical protein
VDTTLSAGSGGTAERSRVTGLHGRQATP